MGKSKSKKVKLFKEEFTFDERKKESTSIIVKYPDRVPLKDVALRNDDDDDGQAKKRRGTNHPGGYPYQENLRRTIGSKDSSPPDFLGWQRGG
ncbi:hypothetical protein Ahy_B01g056456 [Arachis hypogaea]|uniref:Uncharacterized protein n=1 Tax=Arachis hypogaea TaxID=3818 RepID=A0A445AYX7_ARAHY|nr:hypothetical protein Ahy_B01g056456 [Arachis hypogaea]